MPKVLPSSKPQSLPYMRFRNNRSLAILQKDAARDHSPYGASPLPDPEVYHAALNLETKSYDEARRMIAFAFDLLGFERSFGDIDDESDVQKYQWSNGGTYPPHLDIIPHDELLEPKQIFDRQRLIQTVGIITKINVISKCIFAPGPTVKTMADIEAFNRARHSGSQLLPKPVTTMYTEPNIGLLPDWYTDAVFAQQFFTGPNPCTITAALPVWLKRFTDVAKAQGNDGIVKLLASSPIDSFYTLDYSHLRELMGATPDESFSNTHDDVTKYGCAAVALFVLLPTVLLCVVLNARMVASG